MTQAPYIDPSGPPPVRARARTDFFRAWVCTVLAVPLMSGAGWLLVLLTDVAPQELTAYVLLVLYWPIYVLLYVAWGCRAYGVQSERGLAELARREVREQRRWYQRMVGMSGTADVLVSAAGAAVIAVIYIAQQPALRQETVVVVLGLVAVAASWVMMCFSFAQRYLRLDHRAGGPRPFDFDLDQTPRFGEYLTIALMTSTMSAGLPVRPRTRSAWRLIRTNTVVAFAFNSVIVAMVVSLLFGGVTG